nr:hypothetical protein L204_01559 [Cryptococcus depauperatus CBS 7855]
MPTRPIVVLSHVHAVILVAYIQGTITAKRILAIHPTTKVSEYEAFDITPFRCAGGSQSAMAIIDTVTIAAKQYTVDRPNEIAAPLSQARISIFPDLSSPN